MMLLHRGGSRVHCLQTPWRIVLFFYEYKKNSVIGENHGEKGYVIGEILS